MQLVYPRHFFAWSFLAAISFVTAYGNEPTISFRKDIRPILSDHCFACHGPDAQKREADLRLDVQGEAFDHNAIVPGQVDQSLAWERINSDDPETVMPPPGHHKPLTDSQKAKLKQWIESGAEYADHWSFVAPTKPTVPRSRHANPIDAFVAERLKSEGLSLQPRADKRTLIRRVTLDLTGLPPTPEEIDAFLNDKSPDAYSRLVDGLMNRVSYGENMARYWLDLARYADTHGLHLDNERSMWPYRDWVVQAFIENLPFDEFTRWQLAGDLLPNPTRDQLIASGFNRCNVSTSEGGSIAEEWVYRYAVDRTSTMAEVWMGLTAGCAVCHDHKFDPLSTREYYSLYAFFHSAADPAMDGNKLDTPPILKLRTPEKEKEVKQLEVELASAKQALNDAIAKYVYVDPGKLDEPPPMKIVENVWFNDEFPKGAELNHRGHPIRYISTGQGPVFSGDKSLQRTAQGIGQDNYKSGAQPIVVPASASIFARCYLDPDNPPQAIMLQFHTDAWKHRVVWGDPDKIDFGKAGTTERYHAGPLPKLGEWIELEISPTKIGLKGGDKITGFAFTQFDGTVTWDYLGARTKIDTAKSEFWSYQAWLDKRAGTAVKELPDDLRSLVRGKKLAEWTAEENKSVFEFWLVNFFLGGEKELGSVKKAKNAVEAKLNAVDADTPITFVMADLPQPRESFVMIRGAYDKPGEKVQRGVPSFLPPIAKRDEGKDYDRLDLANWLVSREHPLTSRVTVNRFWQQFFGTGLVKTSSDFGSQGEPPSHPELLDWLACEFIESGWDIKGLVKAIVTSSAYTQKSVATPERLEIDPENRLVSRGPRLRLDAEVLRDQALFVSGLLNEQLGGKGVKPYQPPDIWEPVGFGNSNTRYYKQDSGEALYRRSLYTFLKRTAPPPFMSTFDAPNREQSCAFRERSNTPMQALQLMNDIQHVEAARNFAQRMILEGGDGPMQRLRWGWLVATGRLPTNQELQIVKSAWNEHLRRYRKDTEAAGALISYGESKPIETIQADELAAYTLVANLLLNLDEVVCKN